MNEEYGPEEIAGAGFEIPHEITIRIEPFLGRRATLHCGPDGILLVRGGKERRYSWDEVEHVDRYLKDRHDTGFEKLELKLSDRSAPFVLRRGGRWTGPEPEVIANFFPEYLGPPALSLDIQYDRRRPGTVEQADRLLEEYEEGRKIRLLYALLAIASIVFVIIDILFQFRSPSPSMSPFLLLWAFPVLLGLMMGWKWARKIRRLRAKLAAVEESRAEAWRSPDSVETEARRRFEKWGPMTVEEVDRTIASHQRKRKQLLWIGPALTAWALVTSVVVSPLDIRAWVPFLILSAFLWIPLREAIRAQAKEIERLKGLRKEMAVRHESGEEGEEAVSSGYE